MASKSHLYEFHAQYGKMTDFAGFDMPLWYSSIIDEHMAVRNAAGLFDVSHMGRFSIKGEQASEFLEYLLPTFVQKVENGQAFYSVMCKEDGGILDDVIIDKINPNQYVVVVNAANRSKDMEWIQNSAKKYNVSIKDESESSSLLALQGPISRSILQKISDVDLTLLKRYHFIECNVEGERCMVSRTGYTGEDGFEILVMDSPVTEPKSTLKIWKSILDLGNPLGLLPCGLGSRDSLRLEAGMCLYGQDIDERTTPIEASLENIVHLEKNSTFIGRDVMKSQLERGVQRKRIAFSMLETGIPRHGHEVVFAGTSIGTVTSGSYSPILKKGIGMAYVAPRLSTLGSNLWIRIRASDKRAQVVKTPFYDTTRYGSRRKPN